MSLRPCLVVISYQVCSHDASFSSLYFVRLINLLSVDMAEVGTNHRDDIYSDSH